MADTGSDFEDLFSDSEAANADVHPVTGPGSDMEDLFSDVDTISTVYLEHVRFQEYVLFSWSVWDVAEVSLLRLGVANVRAYVV